MPCPSALTYKPAVGVGVAAAVSSVARVLSLGALEDFEARKSGEAREKVAVTEADNAISDWWLSGRGRNILCS